MIVAKCYVKKITNSITSILSLYRGFYKLVNAGRDFYISACFAEIFVYCKYCRDFI